MRAALASMTIVLLFTLSTQAQTRGSQELDSASQQALTETQKMLNDPRKLEGFAATNPQAGAVHKNVQNLMGSPEETAALYKLAAQIFGNMAQSTGGDPAAMAKKLEEAKSNPAAFLNSLTPAQRAQIAEMAKQIESRSPTNAPK